MNRTFLNWIGATITIAALIGAAYWYGIKEPPVGPPASKGDLIVVDMPLPNAAISSPLTISGRARGTWYFEASFPVKLYDSAGNLLAVMPAQAQGEWMTTEYVPFSLTLPFATSSTATGTLVLEKDNPSGLPENANELRIPIRFKTEILFQP